MKTKLILVLILILIIGCVQFVAAQDFLNFYEASSGTAIAKFNAKNGCELASTETLVFKPLTESTFDVRFEMTALKENADKTSVFIRIGNEQQVEFEIGFNDGLITKVNGEIIDRSGYVINHVEEENSKNIELHFVLRIAKDVVRPFSYGEMGSSNIYDQYEIDNQDIHIRTVSAGQTAIKLAIETEFMPELSVSAKSGLKLRETANLNGKVVTTIPYGTSIYVVDSLDASLPVYDSKMVDTKGLQSD